MQARTSWASRSSRAMVALVLGLGALLSSRDAQAQCADGSGETIALTAGIAFGGGGLGALGTAGILARADDSRDFSFALGLGTGIGVAAGLAGLYALVDSSSGCTMANESSPVVWSVPIVTFLVSAALPIAIWGASDKIEDTAEAQQALLAPAAPTPRTWMLRQRWAF